MLKTFTVHIRRHRIMVIYIMIQDKVELNKGEKPTLRYYLIAKNLFLAEEVKWTIKKFLPFKENQFLPDFAVALRMTI